VYDKQQDQVICHSNGCVPMLLLNARVLDMDKPIEKDLACHLKAHAVLDFVAGRLLRVPHETLALVEEMDVHCF
jgi:hypothetical protein